MASHIQKHISTSMILMRSFTRNFSSSTLARALQDGSLRRPQAQRYIHASPIIQSPRKRNFFSSNATLQQEVAGGSSNHDSLNEFSSAQKRKPIRSPAGKTSLRRVAVEAQRSRESSERHRNIHQAKEDFNKVSAVSVADQFDMDAVVRILRSHGFPINPDQTEFDSDQVIHTRGVNNGDIFVFPSGSLVAWSLPEDVVSDLATKTLLPAVVSPHMDQMEMENLEYIEDSKRETSGIKGDVITLGIKSDKQPVGGSRYVFTLRWKNVVKESVNPGTVRKLTQHWQRLPFLRVLLAQLSLLSLKPCSQSISNQPGPFQLCYLAVLGYHSIDGLCSKKRESFSSSEHN
jgi:hypothetical protein